MPSPDDENFLEDAIIVPLEEILDVSRLIMPSREEVASLLDAHDAGTPEFDPHVWVRIGMYRGHLLERHPATPDRDAILRRIDSILLHR